MVVPKKQNDLPKIQKGLMVLCKLFIISLKKSVSNLILSKDNCNEKCAPENEKNQIT